MHCSMEDSRRLLGISSFSVGVVVAAEGYPETYQQGMIIPQKAAEDVQLFYAGVAERAGELVAAGGRVFLAEGQGAYFGGSAKESLPSASKNAFEQDVLSKRYWCQSIKVTATSLWFHRLNKRSLMREQRSFFS